MRIIAAVGARRVIGLGDEGRLDSDGYANLHQSPSTIVKICGRCGYFPWIHGEKAVLIIYHCHWEIGAQPLVEPDESLKQRGTCLWRGSVREWDRNQTNLGPLAAGRKKIGKFAA